MKKEQVHLYVILATGFLSAVFMIFFSNLIFFENIEYRMTDFKFGVRGINEAGLQNSRIVIVAIDDQSFASIPFKYPWPRTYHAKLIKNLNRAGARTIVFDVVFTEESSLDPSQDDIFRDAIMEAGNVVLAGKMVIEEREAFDLTGLLPPIKKLSEVSTFGIADTKFDSDGFVRRYILFRKHNQKRYFSLGLSALASYFGLPGDPVNWLVPTDGGDFILADMYSIKKYDELPSCLINYYGPAFTFKTISYEQVVDDEGFELLLEKDVFKDKIVLIGSTVSELHDMFSTPFYVAGGETLTPGVEIHANFIQSVLDQNFIGAVNKYLVYLLTVVLSVLIAFLIRKTRPLIGLISAIVIGGVYFTVNIILFVNAKILMNFIAPMSGMGLAFVVCNVYQYFSEEKEKIYIRSAFKHYLAENVVDTLLKDSGALTFGGQRRNLTVLFSDIRSFTSYSERYSPEEVVSILEQYLTEMVDVILKYGGMLDKFVGDEIMAVFGAPYPTGNHAEMACKTALEMVRALDRLKEKWEQAGRETFDIGIGINTGDMIVGNLGSKQIFDYTVIGDAVNLGARLEGINKVYRTANNIIISEYTMNEIGSGYVTRELDSVRVKGKEKPVAIFELVGESDVLVYSENFLHHFKEGLKAYKAKEWPGAVSEFQKAVHFTNDEVSKMYIRRCSYFEKHPPGKDWDGVFVIKRK
jgi:adenylate cyclase